MRIVFCLVFLAFISACSNTGSKKLVFNPDFNKYVENVHVVKKGSDFVVYEYKDIRVDELAGIAALYCFEQGDKKARLSEIELYKNNSRRAYFMCDNRD